MAEIVEPVLQFFWEFGIGRAYRKWGWLGGVAAFLAPFLIVAAMIGAALSI
ncbi:hypothetical protein [Sphingomonas sp. S2M10]|uniref:hypothetical protein n=1 Tax=Sphingomonas sp. S2M10 TaxID=2705010 RepID=UPI001457068F|nr:hypothetical protein [Sphingomonas sp. S2M10]